MPVGSKSGNLGNYCSITDGEAAYKAIFCSFEPPARWRLHEWCTAGQFSGYYILKRSDTLIPLLNPTENFYPNHTIHVAAQPVTGMYHQT
jgi:hypothetical protein